MKAIPSFSSLEKAVEFYGKNGKWKLPDYRLYGDPENIEVVVIEAKQSSIESYSVHAIQDGNAEGYYVFLDDSSKIKRQLQEENSTLCNEKINFFQFIPDFWTCVVV